MLIACDADAFLRGPELQWDAWQHFDDIYLNPIGESIFGYCDLPDVDVQDCWDFQSPCNDTVDLFGAQAKARSAVESMGVRQSLERHSHQQDDSKAVLSRSGGALDMYCVSSKLERPSGSNVRLDIPEEQKLARGLNEDR